MRKRRLELFPFYDGTGICEHLAHMAEQGWMIEDISGILWDYRKISPRRMHFFVSYDRENFRILSEKCKIVCESDRMSVFCQEGEMEPGVVKDFEKELEAIQTYACPHVILLYVVLFIVAMYRIFIIHEMQGVSPLDPVAMAYGEMMLLCMEELLFYAGWRAQAKKAMKNGEIPGAAKGMLLRKVLLCFIWILIGGGLLGVLITGDGKLRLSTALIVGWLIILLMLADSLRKWMRRRKMPKQKRYWISGIFGLLAGVLTVILLWWIIWKM